MIICWGRTDIGPTGRGENRHWGEMTGLGDITVITSTSSGFVKDRVGNVCRVMIIIP